MAIVAATAATTVAIPAITSAEVETGRPDRVLDTREGVGHSGRIGPGDVVQLSPSELGVSAGSAVTLNLVATGASTRGFASAWPCSGDTDDTAILNYEPGDVVSNFAVLGVDAAGLCLSSSTAVHLVADVSGSLDGGDVDARSPVRVVDTRERGGRLSGGDLRRIDLGGAVDVPDGVGGVAVNVAVTRSSAGGFLSVIACDASLPPATSTLNFGAGDVVSSFAIASIDGDDLCVWTNVDADLVIDVYGWIRNASDLDAQTPQRLVDTRVGRGITGALPSGSEQRVRVAGLAGVSNQAEAAVVNFTLTRTTSRAFLTAWDCSGSRPTSSVVNVGAGATRATQALLRLANSGELCLRAVSDDGRPVHVIADVVGAVAGNVDRPVPPPQPEPTGRFETLPPGSPLPSSADCAARVRPAAETRPGNAVYNQTAGRANGAFADHEHALFRRVDGAFTGTTDEILQWTACKWGIDEDVVRAQTALESWWHQTTEGDVTGDQSACHPVLRGGSQCPESIGLLQVRFLYHGEAYEDENAIRSSAYNADYAYAVWRTCFEGEFTWLNTVERGATYSAGDLRGCMGVWFSGRWYVPDAYDYLGRFDDFFDDRVWEQDYFLNG
ncbi:MAG: hypothetical protein AAGD33_00120 [Actinomycetota bacterium]